METSAKLPNFLLRACREAKIWLTSRLASARSKNKVAFAEVSMVSLQTANLTDVLESIPYGIILLASDRSTLFANAAASRLTGLPQQGFYLVELARLLQARASVNLEDVVATALTGGVPAHLRDIQVVSFFYDFFITPLYDTAKNIIGGVIVMHDVTDRVLLDQRKTEFVSLASHQLRTPLSTVNWYTEMLLTGDAGKLNDEQKKYLDEVYKGNQRMVALVNALLNVSRLDLGTFVVEPEPTDVVKLAQSAIDGQRPQIEAKKLKLSEKHADNLPLLNADPKLLQMVFQNLLSNAVKYTPDKGKVMIEISLQPSSLRATEGSAAIFGAPEIASSADNSRLPRNDKEEILIKVSDTGFGIPKNQQDKIFSKLFRADNVREKDTEGTGLGLYIVKAIVDHSGGKVWFESVENKGTTFYVALPLGGMKKKEGTKALT